MKTDPRVLIIGGNIGGLAAAIALHKVGISATVFERMPAHPPVAGGLHIASNGFRALERLGVGEALRVQGTQVERFQFRTPKGSIMVDVPAGDNARRTGTSTFFVRRRDLTAVLASALPEGAIQFGAEVARVDDDEDGVLLRLANGQEVRGDVVLASDGLRSRTRTQLFGAVPLRYAGYQDWGAVVNVEESIALPEGYFWTVWGKGLRFGLAHVGRGAVYWAASLPRPPQQTAGPTVAELRALFKGWTEPIPDLIDRTRPEDLFGSPIFDIAPRRPWSRGRIALLGDAAHATTPSAGRGASEALEDGVTVGNALAAVRDFADRRQVSEALRMWEAGRARQTAAVTRLSRHMGFVGMRSTPFVHLYLRATAWIVKDKFRRDVRLKVPPLLPRPQAWTRPVRLQDLTDPREIVAFRLLSEGASGGNESLAYEFVAPDATLHFHAASDGLRGPEAFLAVSRNLRRAFPDLSFDVEEATSNRDIVILHDVMTGTHDGPFQGLPPTGRRIAVNVIHLYRFEGDKVVEGRVVLDAMEVPQQLGALPAPPDRFPKPLAMLVRLKAARRRRMLGP
jgi:2-polyprenyl-6-methoxyphenol hydroxylase-like FAD-dependent oxidoreductase/predicted ester cyclase